MTNIVSMKVRKASSMKGTPKLPGDKSISHRSAMLASIALGQTRISNYSTSLDCSATLKCLTDLGVQIEQVEEDTIVSGVGVSGLSAPAAALDCGNSGTTMRLLAGILSGQNFESTLSGDESLNRRPMERIVRPLSEMGAAISSFSGHAPLRIRGRHPLRAIDYATPVASAQIKSAVLLAGLYADGVTTVTESEKTRDHTERMLELFGISVERGGPDGNSISIKAGQPISPGGFTVPADISAGAFFMVGAACLPDSDVTLLGVGMNPSRSAIIKVLNGLGVMTETAGLEDRSNEPTATIRIRGGLQGNGLGGPARISGPLIPNLIDEIPILAILGTQLSDGLEVRDAAELRHKETDRISAIVNNLKLMGADITEFPDGFAVGPSSLAGTRVDAYGDHRIAMAFAIAGLLADGETEIAGAECADVSFPGFFDTLDDLLT